MDNRSFPIQDWVPSVKTSSCFAVFSLTPHSNPQPAVVKNPKSDEKETKRRK